MINKEAAVIVLRELASDSLILTQRSTQLRNHPGEVCFPGGRWQDEDKNFYETAIRELEEELGIAPSRVHFQSEMRSERTLTGFIIYPWFADIDNLLPYQANLEVSEVFKLPMNEVAQASNYKEIVVNRFGLNIKTYQYKASERFVWGATARIMMQLAEG
ncbi:putative NUDIX hydrolase [Legionella massiliensis]|uniref:Putative NUDIX hydrolase n=1 Tax=Legionella massiliensis TaxID=1034943 RepID=A0A078KZC8_9GAMM|nr:CoA pyrophosphatase [Legionella massiliensis]CDZ78276.1 putative NUDIX hydrolase [Legionella massiliensis]CEE14014.1 putative Nudix hydrolase NudL [Legionella massiliensis]